MSTRSSDTVEWVVNSSPHEQRTVVTLYSGWMPCFIGARSPLSSRVLGSYTGNDQGRSGIPQPRSVDVGPLDVAEEHGVGLGLAHAVHDQLQGLGRVEGAEDAALGQLAVQADLHVPGALELLEDDLVHPRPGVDERGGQDGQ